MPHELTDAGASARSRIAWRLLPFLFLLYVANYLDRTNIAYAALGMKGDLGLTDEVFGTASGIFFIGYLALQIPGALLVERWSARLLLAITLIAWGTLTVLTGLVRTRFELYGARLLLGVAEAAFFPAVIVYLSHWFVYQDRAKAVARFMSAIPVAAIIGGPLAGLILGVHWLGLPGWRWLFFLEGAPAVLLGIATLFVLPDRPADARWLRADERNWLSARLEEERQAKAAVAEISTWRALRSWRVVILTTALLCCYAGGYAFWFWMPTMLQRMTGWTDMQRIGWVSAIPFLAGLVGMLIVGWNSDRTAERRWHFAVPQLTAAAALLAWLFLPRSDVLLIAVFTLVASERAPSAGVLGAAHYIPQRVSGGGAIGFINCIASIGGFFGPKLIGTLSERTGSFDAGFVFMSACLVVGSALVLLCPRVGGASKVGGASVPRSPE
jgi:ACS family tartrate transporter-like MFS transporter